MTLATYDLDTDIGKVRLLCTDTNVASDEVRIFSDAEIGVFLLLTDDSVMYAAAQALETIAASEVLIQKRIKLLELQTDGPAEATALLALAARLREQAASAASTEDDTDFEIAEGVFDAHTYAERMAGELMRNG